MLRFSTSRLGGANVFMMLMRQCNGKHPTFRHVAGPARARKLQAVYQRLSPKRVELLAARAKRVGSILPRTTPKREANQTARFVSKNYSTVTGEPSERFTKLARAWNKSKKASA